MRLGAPGQSPRGISELSVFALSPSIQNRAVCLVGFIFCIFALTPYTYHPNWHKIIKVTRQLTKLTMFLFDFG